MAHIRNPKTHKPESRMPAYDESKISDEDLQALAEFLASLKGEEAGEANEEPAKADEAGDADQKRDADQN